jgi:hypothetical protein
LAFQLKKWLGELSGQGGVETGIDEREDSPHPAAGRESVLNELVRELMRKGIVNENMGREMLQRLA